jgi:hypothetical protein
MKPRQYIDQLRAPLDMEFKNYQDKHGIVTRSFFESLELKERMRDFLRDMERYGIPKLKEDKFEQVYKTAIAECRQTNQIGMEPSVSIIAESEKVKNWLNAERQRELGWDDEEAPTYRNRYINYLDRIGRSYEYIESTKRSSLEIVQKLGDPKSQSDFFIRGLVVGSVQSGKTANFNAVINSAIDAGYDLIIVLSGIIEDLRRQTQIRIDSDVEGKYEQGEFTGVGTVASFGPLGTYKDVRQIILPTSRDTDFRKTIREADFSLNNRNILVCKKNTSVLKNLILWLHNYLNKNKDKIKIPLLIVDDEADNASLNNLGAKGKEYASTINLEIRALLGLFNKKSYLGYTATPFANVLQDRNERPDKKWTLNEKVDGELVTKEFEIEESLFPEHFIVLLFPPPNYVGAKHFFETRLTEVKKIEPLIPKPVSDYEEQFPSRINIESGMPTKEFGKDTRATGKNDHFPRELPESLKEAIMCFVISTAIRLSRRPDMIESKLFQPHNTMLIHISRFTNWQSRTKTLVQMFVSELTFKLNNDLPNDKDSIYGQFERIWFKYYAYVMDNIRDYLPDGYEDEFLIPRTYRQIKPLLITAIEDTEVKAINSETRDVLTYSNKTEKKYIAIGGNRLSRGFTLEGLTINYFIRDTNFADTLLQMGRWFGYRPGYLDCCKLFTTADSMEKFDQTTATIEDLEQRFIDMNRDPNASPRKYGLKVLTHPGTLKITRPSILKNSREVNWSFSDSLEQTTKFKIDPLRISNAWDSVKSKLLSLNLSEKDIKEDDYLVYETKDPTELFEFLNLPNAFNNSKNGEGYFNELIQYIKFCNEQGKLVNWSIALKTRGSSGKLLKSVTGLPCDIIMTKRSGPATGDHRWYNLLTDEGIFAAGRAAANIVTGAKDLSIRLTDKEKEDSRSKFQDENIAVFKKANPDWKQSDIDAIKAKTIPEKVYRRAMKDTEGVLVIYPMDLNDIFPAEGNEKLLLLKKQLDFKIPLIGYAIGIPPVNGDIGGTYLQNKALLESSLIVGGDDDDFDDLKDVLE